MNFDMNNNMSNNNNNRLLRFRSAPSFVLQSIVNDVEKNNDGLNYNFISQSLQDLEQEVDLKPNLVSGFGLNSQFPVNYSRQSTNQAQLSSCSSMAVEVDNLGQQVKTPVSNLFRQNSSPAGLFNNLNPQNGIFKFLLKINVLDFGMILLFGL